MLSNILHFIISIVFSLFGIALLIRAWIYAIRLHPFNPYSQGILRLSNWLIQPLRKVIAPGDRIDWPSLLACWLTAFVFLLLSWTLLTGMLPSINSLLPGLVAAVLTMAKWAFNLILWATLIQVILSWVNPMSPMMTILQTLTAPMLNPIRRVMPDLGGLDLSPLVLLVLAQVAMMILQHFAFSLFGV